MKCAQCSHPLDENYLVVNGHRFCNWTCQHLFHPVFNLQKFREGQGRDYGLNMEKKRRKGTGNKDP